MTTIIFVAIGVLLAAAAAIFVIFYGGSAFGEGATKAEAARLVSEGQQISYATDMFYRQEERMPGQKANGTLDGTLAIQELKDRHYIPISPAGARLTNEDTWKMEYGTDGMIYTKIGAVGAASEEKSLDVCRQARIQLGYKDRDANGDINVYKCDGTDYLDAAWHTRNTLPDREPCCIKG